jgi:hypothetical protein
MAFRPLSIAFALALVLAACGDDDSGSSGGKSGSGASGGSSGSLSSSGSGGTSSVNTGGGTGGINGAGTGAGGAGTGAGGTTGGSGGSMGGRGGSGGMGGSGGSAGTFMMAMCPSAMPEDGSACMGRRLNCMFGSVQCLCRFGMWSCDSSPGGDMDGGTP